MMADTRKSIRSFAKKEGIKIEIKRGENVTGFADMRWAYKINDLPYAGAHSLWHIKENILDYVWRS